MSERPERKWKTIRDLGLGPVADDPVVIEEEDPAVEEGADFSGQAGEGIDQEQPESEPVPAGPQRVLVAFPSAPTNRLLRETLENFTHSRVDTTSDPVRAFEMALQKPYRILFLGFEFEEMSGPVLYELICRIHSTGNGPKQIAPGVIFVRESKDVKVSEEIIRDARVKDIISKPIRIDRLLRSVEGILEIHDPTTAG